MEPKISASPGRVCAEKPPPPFITSTPPKPSTQPAIFHGVRRSERKNSGAASTVRNDAQAVLMEVFAPVVKPMPI